MSLPATLYPLPHVGAARDRGPDLAARADPKIRVLLWGGQFGNRAVRTNDVPHLQCRYVHDVPPAPVTSTDAGAPHDRRVRQCPISSRKAPRRLPASPCSTAAPDVPAAVQPATRSDRAGVEIGSAPGYSQSLLRHPGRSGESRQRLLQSLTQA